MTHLDTTLVLPRYQPHVEKYNRFLDFTSHHTERALDEYYWTDAHLAQYRRYKQNHSNAYRYFEDTDTDAFADVDEYLYQRYQRAVYTRLAGVFDAHTDEQQAFAFILDTVNTDWKIQRIGWHRIRDRLFADDSPYISWGVIQNVVEQLNNHYDTHGAFPDAYTEMINTPSPNGTTPYSPDSRGDLHDLNYNEAENTLEVTFNLPAVDEPSTHFDWDEHSVELPVHERFGELLDHGDLCKPTLRREDDAHGDTQYVLDVPVDIDEIDTESVDDRVLAVDLGVKKLATCAVLDDECADDAYENGAHGHVKPPAFVDHEDKDKLFRLKENADGLNDKLARLRREGRAHSDKFAQLHAEYKHVRGKERRLREQIQQHVANELVWLAVSHECETIVFEDLAALQAEQGSGRTSWSISSWARGALLDNVGYRAELLGLDVETVNPWGTSRHCPRCGEKGETVVAPNDLTPDRAGGYFHCPHEACEYRGCDRDVAGAVNTGRKYLSDTQLEEAKPVVYTTTGNHASSSERDFDSGCSAGCNCEAEAVEGRSAGVHPTTRSDADDLASEEKVGGASTKPFASLDTTPLTVKGGGRRRTGMRIDGSREGRSSPVTNSVTRRVLVASATECY